MTRPAEALTAPDAEAPIPDLVGNILGASQYISPSYWFNEVATRMCHTDPMSWISEQFAGDWESVQKASVALNNLSTFSSDYSGALTTGTADLLHEGEGHAADEAGQYFATYARDLESQAKAIGQIADQVRQQALGMYEASNAVKDLWGTLFDMILTAAISMAAAVFTGGVGAVVGGGATLAEIAAAAKVWSNIVEVTGEAWTGAQGSVGLIAGYLGGMQTISVPALPSVAYDHPGV
ncbi:hypothetical protein G4X40_14185 [Rhodococcus sp. D2-41]|uniref:Uncharacterized protein n=1 Tax=Speluncibacter jeojiensis TaxID=2710754 RepID=A0A9X4RER0_9ACTN|nr:hypothetical protein [Rhodococcus sp. D2-41]MDG3011301.1 hypothetical protein [Rhodococcus sp. D2-41]MDG3015848.1 hypothetical protein [Corynebacteriales bacterium D3-21]